MGIILLPGFLFHFGFFVLGLVLIGMKSKSVINFIKYSAIPTTISSLAGYLFLNYIFSVHKNEKMWAFDILIELVYGKHLILILIPTLVAIYIFKKKNSILLSSIFFSFQMMPFSSIVMYVIFSSEYFKYYGISITY